MGLDEIETACRQAGTAFFFKQWGGKNKKAAGRTLNGRTYDEMPGLTACSYRCFLKMSSMIFFATGFWEAKNR